METFDGASSSSSAVLESQYQVFLSFRGEDTRKNFTDHLYCYLRDARIRTFRDNEELRVGNEIRSELLRAIEESTISIPIISKGYASSKWCLIELTHMLKCRKSNNMGRPEVCPIFYDVSPSDCKHQTGSFAEAFVQHSKDFDERTVEEWKEALNEITKLKGWEKDKVAQGHEGELVNLVASEICMKLGWNHVKLSDNLVGMGHHLEKMKQLLDLNCDDVRVIGIHGMGGIGKTTIAKFLYNELGNYFRQQCSFLEDIREKVRVHKSYDGLKKQLISDLLKRKPDGINLNRNTFKDKKVLLVLDNVEERSQLSEIIGNRDWFGSGSRIIVTTRNKEVFEECQGDLIYEHSVMTDDESLLLFCKYAFESNQPREGYEAISREVVSTAAGLPLSLVVIGSQLFAKEKTVWEATLKLLRTIPADKVQERLKISYDALNYRQKQIFLDIACHFIGEYKTYAFYMWDGCSFYPEMEVKVLINLSLITIGEDNIIRMHDHLRDLGRYIVYQESPNDPGQRSRVWSPEEAQQVLHSQSRPKKVETCCMKPDWDFDWSSDCISNDDLKGLSSLRYLHLEDSTLKGDFRGLVSNLRWFRLRFKDSNDAILNSGCWGFGLGKSRMRVTNFCADKLVILDLSESDIRDGWESWIQIKAATNLKVLNLSQCDNLTKLPECLWNLKSLVELDLSDTAITELSEQGIGNLTNLTKLLLNDSRMKRLPDAIGKLEKLQVLDCSRCKSLEGELPEGIWSLSSLRVLNFLGCYKITVALPKDISGMSHLETLDLGRSENIRLPTEGLKLPLSLTRLDIPFTKATLESLRSLVNLRKLEFRTSCRHYCDPHPNNNDGGTPLLPTIDMPSNLEDLTLYKFDDHVTCCRLLPVPVMKFDSSSRLHRLVIEGFGGVLLSGSVDLSNCQMLIRLEIRYCHKTREIGDFGSSWEYIKLYNCGSLKVLPDLSTMKRLKTLELYKCPMLREIKGLEVLTSLEELIIGKCAFGTSTGLLDLSNCQMLRRLEIDGCDELREIAYFGKLGSTWEDICISDCKSLEVLPDLSSMKKLMTLRISRCPKLREIKGLEVLTSLEDLTIAECAFGMSTGLLDLSNCQMLRRLEIDGWDELREIAYFGNIVRF